MSPGSPRNGMVSIANSLPAIRSGGPPTSRRTPSPPELLAPGIVVLRARHGGETVGANLWYQQGEIAYYHLGAYAVAGYELRASFALFARALELFAERGLAWASLGAGAGGTSNPDDGLTRFKRGWSTGTQPRLVGRKGAPRGRLRSSGRTDHRLMVSGISGRRIRLTLPRYRTIVDHYEACLEQPWRHASRASTAPNASDADTRHQGDARISSPGS